MSIIEVPCSIIRGGTSKGIFVREQDLPAGQAERDTLVLALFGSPDIRQIDGLGGADPLTSKLAIVSPSPGSDCDVEFLAAEVAIDEAHVNYGIMCGNTLAGVGSFAIEQGFVTPVEPVTEVRVLCRNNNLVIVETVPVKAGRPVYEGECRIDGVPGTGAPTGMEFLQPGGAITGRLLPTTKPVDTLPLGDRQIECSVVDSGTLYAFLRASDLGVTGYERPETLDSHAEFRATIEAIRERLADILRQQLGLDEMELYPRRIKMAIVSPPGEYVSIQGETVHLARMHIAARIINPMKVHKAYAVSGAICLASAAVIPGTVVHAMHRPAASPAVTAIGHPSGILEAKVTYTQDGDAVDILGGELQRTARLLMSGVAYVKV